MSKQSKILRIKVENLGSVRIYTLEKKKRFTLGYDPKNSIQIFGSGVTKRFDLISVKENIYYLKVQENTVGEIVIGDSSLSIRDLIKHNFLKQVKDGYLLELTDEKKASLTIYDHSFQFGFDGKAEVGNEVVEYWKFRRRIIQRFTSDWLYKSILVTSLFFGFSFSYYVYGLPYVESNTINLESYTRYVAKVIIRQPQKEEVKLSQSRQDFNQPSNETSSTKKETDNETESSPPAAKSTSPVKPAVTKRGLLGLIGGKGTSDNPGVVIESLMGKGLIQEINDILNSGQNLVIELPSLDDLGDLGQLIPESELEVDNLISEMQVDEKIVLKDKGEVELQSLDEIQVGESGLGYRDEKSLLDVLNSYKGRITFTYNKYLKQFPRLRGKVILEITVNAEGLVTLCKVISSTLGNSELENELVALIKDFQFKPVAEGDVTFQNPFVFFRQGT